jgi:hypothetical protein
MSNGKKNKLTQQCVVGEDRKVATDRRARQPLSDLEHRGQLRRALIASTIGTTIEWYDFLLYSTVTGLVFAKLFFPDSDPLIGTLQAYVIFYTGFIARPVGAAIFGHYGDRIGRKATLILLANSGARSGRQLQSCKV